MPKKKIDANTLVATALRKHFGDIALSELTTACRKFPVTTRVDLQKALDEVFTSDYQVKLFGLHRDYNYSTLTFSAFLDTERNPIVIGPLQFDEIDIGEDLAGRCLKQGLWMCQDGNDNFAVLLSSSERHGTDEGMALEIAVPPGEKGMQLSHSFLSRVEKLVACAGSYRGKVISLEQTSRYSGKAGTVRVHRLHSVAREDVILPDKTLKLLERNVTDFIQQRERLRQLGMPIKKGLLFYGSPGTGKTHTIHYLASKLPDHTTLLITAGQVGLLEEYFLLARFLQPAMVIIEDVDLIARDRESMDGPCEESLLNRLLNEMDGLREDAAMLFVLTTNRPEHLEAALASRPGRIDQAIEFPLPDAAGRRKLIKLYSRGLPMEKDLLEDIVRKTAHASPAFIKELLRKAAQHLIQDGANRFLVEHIDSALEDMLFCGGSLNVKLLGGAVGQKQTD
jgi:AAA+ superfamily predicted ATPase